MTAALTPFQQSQIAKLRQQRLNFTEIEAKTGVSRHTVAKYCAKIDKGKAIKDTPAAALTADDVAWLRQQRGFDQERIAVRQIAYGLAAAMSTIQCPRCGAAIAVLRSQTAAGCRRCKVQLNMALLDTEEPPDCRDGGWPGALVSLVVAQLGRQTAGWR